MKKIKNGLLYGLIIVAILLSGCGNSKVQTSNKAVIESVVEGEMESADNDEMAEMKVSEEAAFISESDITSLLDARLCKEQMRAETKAALMEIINDENVSDEQKQEAINNMITLTDISQKEIEAEALLEEKGFISAVVIITDSEVDVVIATTELSDDMRKQIENIVEKKTGVDSTNIVITTISESDITSLLDARLCKEQMRAETKAALMEIINDENVSDEQKQEAINNMITLTDISQKEIEAEALLEEKGFTSAVVIITDSEVDVVIATTELSDDMRKQIENIVEKKTGVDSTNIVITTVEIE